MRLWQTKIEPHLTFTSLGLLAASGDQRVRYKSLSEWRQIPEALVF